MTVSRLVFKLLYPLCCADTKIILGNMDAKAEQIQQCANDRVKQVLPGERGWVGNIYKEDFGRWLDILERGTFSPVERIAIKAALYDHKREATRKLIYSTLVDGGSYKWTPTAQADQSVEEIKDRVSALFDASSIGIDRGEIARDIDDGNAMWDPEITALDRILRDWGPEEIQE